MTNLPLAYAHLATVVPAFGIGTYLMVRRKGTMHHRRLGRTYLMLMLATALITLFMGAEIGPRFFFGHFGYIHALSLLTLVTVPIAYFAARSGQVALHRSAMIGLYVGGLLIAGSFAFMPGRLLHGWLFGG
ncbi:DUF2306 domain-containing protein [Azotobacter armeniacus]